MIVLAWVARHPRMVAAVALVIAVLVYGAMREQEGAQRTSDEVKEAVRDGTAQREEMRDALDAEIDAADPADVRERLRGWVGIFAE